MNILVENLPYDTDLLKKHIDEKFMTQKSTSSQSYVDYIGYYKNEKGTITLIFPKNFVDEKYNIFEDINYKEFLNEDSIPITSFLREKGKSDNEIRFIAEFSSIIFRVIKKYIKRNENIPNYIHYSGTDVITSQYGKKFTFFLDIILSLIKIHKENKYLFFQDKNISRNLTKKINWKKTVNKINPVIHDDGIIYFDTISEKRGLTQEDSLLIIFYSVLNEISITYGYDLDLDENLPILTGHSYAKLKKNAIKIIKNIRFKYYTDLHKRIINLLFLYFYEYNKSRKKENRPEYLLANNFHLIFEDIIDFLISDKNDLEVFKYQKDGKILDHIYHDKSLVQNNPVYFVGDSKYYQDPNSVSELVKYKQYTYAKNVIQICIDSEKKLDFDESILQIRNTNTEGYEIIPSFFIFGYFDYNEYNTKRVKIEKIINLNEYFTENSHFENRIFDRDSFCILYLKINIIYAFKLYYNGSYSSIKEFKQKIRKAIREQIIKYYNRKYEIYYFNHKNIEDFINVNFKKLIGKIYYDNDRGDYILSLHKKFNKENEEIKILFRLKNIDLEKTLFK